MSEKGFLHGGKHPRVRRVALLLSKRDGQVEADTAPQAPEYDIATRIGAAMVAGAELKQAHELNQPALDPGFED